MGAITTLVQWFIILSRYNVVDQHKVKQCIVLLNNVELNPDITFIDEVTAHVKYRKKTYTCYVCMSKFFSKADLQIHRDGHGEESDSETSKNEEKDSDYSENEEKDSDYSENEEVETEYESDPSQVNSESTVLIGKIPVDHPFGCATCGAVFEKFHAFRDHLMLEKKCEYTCKACVKYFGDSASFLIHIIQHRDKWGFFKCGQCKRSFLSYRGLRRHEEDVHSAKAPPKKDQPIVKKELVPKMEIIDVDDEHATKISCEICFDVFTTESEFEKHLKLHKLLGSDVDCKSKIIIRSPDMINESSSLKGRIVVKRDLFSNSTQADFLPGKNFLDVSIKKEQVPGCREEVKVTIPSGKKRKKIDNCTVAGNPNKATTIVPVVPATQQTTTVFPVVPASASLPETQPLRTAATPKNKKPKKPASNHVNIAPKAIDPQSAWNNSCQNLLYIIAPINDKNTQPKPQMAYINNPSNFSYYLQPSQSAQFVAPVQNSFPVADNGNIVYQPLKIAQDQIPNTVAVPTVLPTDNNFYIITNPQAPAQSALQANGVVNSVLAPNSIQTTTGYASSSLGSENTWQGFIQ